MIILSAVGQGGLPVACALHAALGLVSYGSCTHIEECVSCICLLYSQVT